MGTSSPNYAGDLCSITQVWPGRIPLLLAGNDSKVEYQ